MAFKFIEEFEPFLKSDPYAGATHLQFYLWNFMVEINVTISDERVGSITFYDRKNIDKFVSFVIKQVEVNNDRRRFEKKEYIVAFSDTMNQREKQSLYSRVKDLIKKGYKKFSFYDDYEYIDFDNDPRFPSIKSYVCGTEHLWLLYLKPNRELHPALDRDIKRYLAISVRKWGATCFVLHDPSIDPFRFLKPIKQETNKKIQPITDKEKLDAERDHKIDDDFDIVENITNTDEDNHGGNSVAHEVENGDSRDNGITDKDSDNSAVPASDTADDTTKDNSTDGFQSADGESGSDSVIRENSVDTQLGSAEGLSLSNGGSYPQTTLTPDEDAGSQEESPLDAQGAEGKNMDAVVGNTQKDLACGEGVLSMIENFLNDRSFNSPRKNSREEAQSIVEEYKSTEIDRKVFRKLNSIFKKHLSVSSMGKESPTLDKKLLIKKLMSFQSPYTAFKKDVANEKVFLLVDVSGSMTNFYDLIPYFYRLSVVLKDIIVVVNINMYPDLIIEKGKVYDVRKEINANENNSVKMYDELLRKYSVKTIINFTDFDGVDLTADILAKTSANMIIMDVYSCNVLDYKPFKDTRFKKLPEVLMPYRNRITYYYGVGSFEGVIEVLNKEL